MNQPGQEKFEVRSTKQKKDVATRAFWQEGKKLQDYSFFDFIHGYIYARWPYQYIGMALGKRNRFLVRMVTPVINLFQKLFSSKKDRDEPNQIEFADTYHGKAVPLETATRLVSVKESIDLGDLEQVIPYKLARDLILKNPDHIVVLDCPCRVARENPCLPLDVCLVVGEPFASLIVEHHPERSRWITSQEAVGILEAEDERGHVHHAFFKDAHVGPFLCDLQLL